MNCSETLLQDPSVRWDAVIETAEVSVVTTIASTRIVNQVSRIISVPGRVLSGLMRPLRIIVKPVPVIINVWPDYEGCKLALGWRTRR